MPVSVTCGSHHTAVITRRGDLISWGMGTSGQTGHGPLVGDVRSPFVDEILNTSLTYYDHDCLRCAMHFRRCARQPH